MKNATKHDPEPVILTNLLPSKFFKKLIGFIKLGNNLRTMRSKSLLARYNLENNLVISLRGFEKFLTFEKTFLVEHPKEGFIKRIGWFSFFFITFILL